MENFFLQIWHKIRYLNLSEFAYTMCHAKHEIIKRNATDYTYIGREERIEKKYNNQEGVEFSIDDITYVTKKDWT